MAVGKGFFDQYSVFCVFGSVVGCVVVPLITQSVESVIFSAIVISLTATHLTKRASKSDNTNQVFGVKEVEKRSNRKAKDRDTQNGQTKRKKNVSQQIVITRSSDTRKRREADLEKLELARQQENDRKQEEKKEKKMKKKEQRMKKKEQEKEEKEVFCFVRTSWFRLFVIPLSIIFVYQPIELVPLKHNLLKGIAYGLK